MKCVYFKLSLVLSLIFTLASCGIDTIAFLDIKAVSISNTDKAIVFSIPSSGSDNYLGLCIFYRIYANKAQADNDRSSIESRQAGTNALPGAFITSYLLAKSGLEYHGIFYEKDADIVNQLPVISKSFSGSYCSIEFNATATMKINNEVRNIYRTNEQGNSTSFFAKPINSSPDFEEGELEGKYYVQFFASAYGIDFSSISELYGDAVYLGTITVDAN